MTDRWEQFDEDEVHAISSALWTTSELYPGRSDHDVMVELRSQAMLVAKRRAAVRRLPRARQSVPGRMSLTVLEKG